VALSSSKWAFDEQKRRNRSIANLHLLEENRLCQKPKKE